MKKFSFCLMALALVAATFTSCHKDDDEEETKTELNTLSATCGDHGEFSTSLAGFYQSASSDNSGTSKLSDFFDNEEGSTTIAGTAKMDGGSKQLAINIKGTTAGTYRLAVSTEQTITNAIIDLLSGKSTKETFQNAVDGIETNALIIYRSVNDTEESSTYYFSTEATVTFDNTLIVYSTGTFTATMVNKDKDTFTISDGTFKVFGKPTIGGSK